MGRAYYNEIDPFAAQWLRNLIAAGHIAPGDVDERDIRDVRPDELAGYTQCHFFAGIGGWSLAARRAGWPDDKPLWTGSCPCQPFSSAARGRNRGFDCDRHLWPNWRQLIAACRPPVVAGEQVADARDWLDQVWDDMEADNYALWAGIIPAFSVGADHIRDRIWFLGDTDRLCEPGLPVDAEVGGLPGGSGQPGGMVSAHGVSTRMAQMRAFGNAIVPEVAAQVLGAYLEHRADAALAAGSIA